MLLNGASNVLEVEEEAVVAEYAEVLAELLVLDAAAPSELQRAGDFALLPRREQDIARHTEHQSLDTSHRLQPLHQIHGRPTRFRFRRRYTPRLFLVRFCG